MWILVILSLTIAAYALSALILPFPNWTSFNIAFWAVAKAPNITLRQRASMFAYLLREIFMLPVWATFWIMDDLLFSQYRNEDIPEPIFIVSQPRSGTTFLLRTLSEDRDTFLSVKHLEWRYPYISFWKLIDLLGLRMWLETRSYWPDTELGRTCRKIHYHVLGNYEEFGIFLEERFFHHYFVFRRFPFNSVLERVSQFDSLSDRAKDQMVTTFLRVVRKVYFYRGNGEIFLAKENENVEFCRAVIERLSDARVLMICREPQPMLDSYFTMSVTCTEVKHGVDPTNRIGWQKINTDFRREQCQKFVNFWHNIQQRKKAVLVSFRDYTTDVRGATQRIYQQFGLSIQHDFHTYLEEAQKAQSRRNKGYANFSCSEPGFEFYSDFVSHAEKNQKVLSPQ
jgi:hypothetical protein